MSAIQGNTWKPAGSVIFTGRTGQEFNQRKKRKGTFREDRYHATAIESGEHLLQCLIYIDLNMVRAGAVKHPSDWPYCVYNESQTLKRKNILIDYERLRVLLGFDNYKNLQAAYRKWVASGLENGTNTHDEKWTASLAVGNKAFVEDVQVLMGASARGRKPRETGKSYQLWEAQASYADDFGGKKCEIALKNAFSWH